MIHDKRNSCRVLGKWTPSHQNRPVKEEADKQAKIALNKAICTWTRTTLTSARTKPHHRIIEQWATPANPKPLPKPFPPTAKMPRRSSRAIAHIRHSLTALDPSRICPSGRRTCDTSNTSAKHIILGCPETNTVTARTALMNCYNRPQECNSITDRDTRPKEFLKFAATTGLVRIRHVIMNVEDARDAGYELGNNI